MPYGRKILIEDDHPDYESATRAALVEIGRLTARVVELEAALHHIIGTAGHPKAADGCRLIINRASDVRLFVWSNPYPVSYGSSMVFAVAETVEQAREIAKTAPRYAYNEFHSGDGCDAVLGEPIRVVDLPCAEWHEWSE